MAFNFRGEFEGEPPTPEDVGRVLREVYALLRRGSLPPESRPEDKRQPTAKVNTARKQRKKKEGSK